ncbi:MAG: hypothetical protein ACJAZ3_000796 [Sphingobacteriales bacterium]|jgi:hypothetical protein
MKYFNRLIIIALSFLVNSSCTEQHSTFEGNYFSYDSDKKFITLNPKSGDTVKRSKVVIHVTSLPATLNTTHNYSGISDIISGYTCKYLVKRDYKTGLLNADLATWYSKDSDVNSVYYKLNEQYWGDSSLVSALDVLFSFKVYSMPLVNNSYAKAYLKKLDSISVSDDSSVRFKFKDLTIFNSLMSLGFPILKESFFDPNFNLRSISFQQVKSNTNFEHNQELINSISKKINTLNISIDNFNEYNAGAYKVLNFEPKTKITLVNKSYTNSTSPDTIVFTVNKNPTVTKLNFQDNNYDISFSLDKTNFEALLKSNASSDYNFIKISTPSYWYMAFNTTSNSSIVSKTKFRKAIQLIMPKEQIAKLVLNHDSSYWTTIDFTNQWSMFSPIKTNTAIGLTLLNEFITANPTIAEASFSLLYNSEDKETTEIVQLIVGEFAKHSIKVEANGLMGEALISKRSSGDFEALLGTWGMSKYPNDLSQLWQQASESTNTNFTGFGSSYTDSLLTKMNTTSDSVKLLTIRKELRDSINNQVPYIFLFNDVRYAVINKKIRITLFNEKPYFQFN